MAEVSLFRLYLLRATYLLIALGLGSDIWPAILTHAKPWSLMQGVAMAMLGAVSALSVLGLRYPLRMLPLLFLETFWKATWLIVVAFPAWQAGKIDAAMSETVFACLMGVIFPIVIPWGYVVRTFVAGPGDPWTHPGTRGETSLVPAR